LIDASFASTQKFELPPFLDGCSYGNKIYGVEVSFNGMIFLLIFIKIDQSVQKLMGGKAHRHDGDFINLLFSFRKESRLKNLNQNPGSGSYHIPDAMVVT
jgi:hypothetical protein